MYLLPHGQSLIYQAADNDEEEEEQPAIKRTSRDENSSSDDNDSTEAAHAAAIGHSPQLFKSTDHVLPAIPEHLKQGPLSGDRKGVELKPGDEPGNAEMKEEPASEVQSRTPKNGESGKQGD